MGSLVVEGCSPELAVLSAVFFWDAPLSVVAEHPFVSSFDTCMSSSFGAKRYMRLVRHADALARAG